MSLSIENMEKLQKIGYRFVGNYRHAAAKICHWTKKSILDEGVCYKQKFYGIESHRCLQMSPSIPFCHQKCLFCWRDVSVTETQWKGEMDEPGEIIDGSINAQRNLLCGFFGNDKANKKKLDESQDPKHAAISLAGEPMIYPKIDDLIEEFHRRDFTTFLVTNGMNPQKLENLKEEPTQLYLSLDAPDKKIFEKLCIPQIDHGWEKLNKSLDLLSSFKCRSVVRMTCSRVGAAQRELLELIAEGDSSDVWVDQGARDMAHFVSIRYGISCWKARRWIAAAYALEELPEVADALETGELSLDKVVELTRFASAETESRLIRWAAGVSVGAIRHKGDLLARSCITETLEAERARSLDWWYVDDGRRLAIQAELPAAQGAVVTRAIERMAAEVPVMPDERGEGSADARRADALVALCSARLGADPDPDRATVVVHARAEALERGMGGCEIEGGPVISQRTARRLLCNARIQSLLEDHRGDVIGLGRMSREPSAWMVRQVRHRDRECRFPGCGARSFTESHHIRWWRHGGRTELDNLVLICSFHHRLVHEYGWSLARGPDGEVTWFREDGTRYRAGPSPGGELDDDREVGLEPALAGVG